MASVIRGNDNFDSGSVGSTTAGAVGTYALASWPSPGSAKTAGDTVAGSTLRLAAYSYTSNNNTAYGGVTTTGLSGTWQLMGGWTGNSSNQASVFIRIS